MNADKPMKRKTNALAELAERLRRQYESQTSWWQDDIEGMDFDKAQRIVEELAKVRFNRHEIFGEYANGDDLIKVMNNCREIAAEGANDGKR